MNCRANGFRVLAALLVIGAAGAAEAGLLRRTTAPTPVPAPNAAETYVVPAPAPTVSGVPCKQVCATYRHRGIKVRCNSCSPPIKLMLTATDPCSCCLVCIPVCLPACCCGDPCVTCRDPVLGTQLVRYEWSCGVAVTVRFHRDGDVIVTYWRA